MFRGCAKRLLYGCLSKWVVEGMHRCKSARVVILGFFCQFEPLMAPEPIIKVEVKKESRAEKKRNTPPNEEICPITQGGNILGHYS